jgi:hypothetical protein
MVSTREHPEMGRIPVSPSGLESAYWECVADPNGGMHPSEGCNPGKGRERGGVLRGGGISSIGSVPSERVDLSGVVPKVCNLGLVCVAPLGRVSRIHWQHCACNGASNKSNAAETAALHIGRRRPCVRLIFHGLRNPKGYHPAFRRVRGAGGWGVGGCCVVA